MLCGRDSVQIAIYKDADANLVETAGQITRRVFGEGDEDASASDGSGQPDGEDKPAFLQLMAWLDSIPQCPDHVLVSPGLTLTDAGRALGEAFELETSSSTGGRR